LYRFCLNPFIFTRSVVHTFLRTTLLLFVCCLSVYVQAQNTLTAVQGKVTDARTGEGLPYATVQFAGEALGTRTDIDGFFYLETRLKTKKIQVTYVGYTTKEIAVEPGRKQTLNIALEEKSVDIKEITIRPEKYRNRNNPAVDLIEEVFKHKDQNRKEGLDYYSFEKYEKLQLDLNNINDKFRKRWYLRKFQFIFDNVDTNRVNGKVAWPFYLRERLLNVYYRKSPTTAKEYLVAEKQTGFGRDYDIDQEGISGFLNNIYQEVDIYEPTIPLLTTEFMGPLSGNAPLFYRFYIIDTVELEGKKYADVFFAPRNKSDLAFMGNLLVALDSTFAVKKVEMGISKDINLNWVSDLHFEQEFEFMGEGENRRLMLVKDALTMDLNILKRAQGRSLLARKTGYFRNYALGTPLPDSLFRTQIRLMRDTGAVSERPPAYWAERRYLPLNHTERTIDHMIDSIQKVPVFKVVMTTASLLTTGFHRFKNGVELGPVSALYSFNDVEGARFRIGGRTNQRLIRSLRTEAYLAYGLRDQRWKYNVMGTWAFNKRIPRMFPMHQMTVSYLKDLRNPAFGLENWMQDNLVTSFQRGVNDKMLFNEVFRAEYLHEYRTNFSYTLSMQRRNLPPAGSLFYAFLTPDGERINKYDLRMTEAGVSLRYAPNEKFYQGTTYRAAMLTRFPVFSLSYRTGIKGLMGSEYNYHRLAFRFRKMFFIAPLGRSEWTIDLGQTFGRVPYPLLELHQANQSYIFDWYSYNLMNFLEFASDRFGSLMINHNFNGFFLNKIPLIKKLQLREMCNVKLLYGSLSDRNRPTPENGLLVFPADAQGTPLLNTLGKDPYVELSLGLSNIFKFLRVDYVRRMTYTEQPNISRWGIRFSFLAGF
jgi:hypothetical protein